MFQSGRPRLALLLAAALLGAATGHALDARSPDAEIRRFAAEGLPDGPAPEIVSDDLVRPVPPACPAAALASGRATASPLRMTVAVEPGAPPATSPQVVARLSNHSDEHVVVTLSACPPVAFLVDDAAGRTVSGRVSGVCADASTYLIHSGGSYAIASANWPLPGSHTPATADYSVRAVLEEWSCGSDSLPSIESERAVVRIGALPVRPQTASGSW